MCNDACRPRQELSHGADMSHTKTEFTLHVLPCLSIRFSGREAENCICVIERNEVNYKSLFF